MNASKHLIGGIAVALASVHSTTAAGTADFRGTITGNQLLDLCGGEVSQQTPNPSAGICVGYVQGVYESLTLSGKERFCPRANVTVGQVVDIVVASLKRYPEIRDYAAPVIVMESVKKAFPCPES
jgi:hypothetical protein